MSFLFGKSKKHQNTALPAATRDISSSHGQGSLIPTANGLGGRDPEKARGGPPTQTPTPGSSVNNSLNSLQAPTNTSSPEPKTLRERSDSELHNPRATGPNPRGPQDSPYPWSQRRLNFTTTANPFPRYGAAVNSTASKDGVIYIMGGLINGSTVKGDLWMVEVGSGTMACYPISTTGDGPGPRVGHSSLLVGNAFIVFGGDTKMDDGDMLDDTLYLLNTSTKHWSRAMPAGPRPSGRYGHTLNILGSKIYIFGGQVEGFFFNDLVAFDLNSLQSATSGWEVLIPNTKEGTVSSQGPSPPARTNHSIVTWNDKLYLFGGTDGLNWFNDVWTYDPRTNSWTELDCIGYIPVAREGHAAALVNDTMYIFGGRTREGVDLGDLAAFRISSRRWYMFQNMGLSPSARSGHSMTAFGKHVVVLAGEPSSAPSDRGELSLAYILDTSKIRYPANESQPPMSQQLPAPRKMSGSDRSGIPQSKLAGPVTRESVMGGQQPPRGPEPAAVNGAGAPGSRLPRAAGSQPPAGPPPMQQAPQPRANGVAQGQHNNARSKTPTKVEREFGPPVDTTRTPSLDRENVSPGTKDGFFGKESEMSMNKKAMNGPRKGSDQSSVSQQQSYHKESMDTARSGSVVSRNTSRSHRQQHSLESIDHSTPRRSLEAQQRALSREAEHRPVDSGVGSSPALSQQNDELLRELEAAKNRNAWYASELALARKAGYHPNASSSPILDERAADVFGDDDRPLLEALLKMRAELAKVQGSIDSQTVSAANKIAEVEKQRDAAINEAVYAKTKLAAHGGSQAGTPQPDGSRGTGTPELDRVNEINRRLAASLAAQTELSSKLEKLNLEVEAERKARRLAEETAEAAQKRVSELDSYRQRSASEMESLRAELHEAQRIARDESANSSEARASSRLLAVDKNELSSRLTKVLEDAKNHATVLQSLRDAVTASSDKASLLERKLEDERSQRDSLEQKLFQLRAEHEDRTTELESTSRRLRDTEELAEKHAVEARMHRQAVLSGLSQATEIDDDGHEAADERVTILQQQVEAANAMVRKNQEAADLASEKLRRAEERIAGLEAYQEQASREGLSIRKQLQQALREVQSSQAEKAELRLQYERHQLENNALEVQLKTLKNLLEERGVNAVDARRSRILDSPSSRFGTPELNRVRELEQQLDASIKAHDEMRSTFEQREHDVSKEWEEKLTALHNDHQAAVKYLRGTEKMLTKMKQELERYKGANTKLEEELAQARQAARSPQPPSGWESERESLQNEISSMQANLKTSVTHLESQLSALRSELASVYQERDSAAQHAQQVEASMQQSRADLDALRLQNEQLEERARDAEQRVQMFLDQFESSVDSYRRQSQVPVGAGHEGLNGNHGHYHNSHDSISGDSIYTDGDGDGDGDGDVTPDAAAAAAAAATRNSVALDNLATELDALRSHWETTNKAYRLSDRFDFERTPTSEKSELSDSLAAWRKRMDLEDDEHDEHDRQQGRKGSHSQASGAPANGIRNANSAGVGPGGSAMI